MKDAIIRFWKDEEGATAIEYGLIAGLIAVGILAILSAIGGQLQDVFGRIRDALTTAGFAAPK